MSKMTTNIDLNNIEHVTDEWNQGPDKVIPTELNFAHSLNQAVKIRVRNQSQIKFPPLSVYSMFKQTVNARPNHLAIGVQIKDDWIHFTYSEYWKICEKAAKSFIKLGLEPNNSVGIIGFNSIHWFISMLGTIFAGGVGCGIYTTNSAEACEYILKDSKCRIIVVENKQQLDKILKCRENFLITAIIQYNGNVENDYNGLVWTWKDFIEFGNDIGNETLDRRVKGIAPNKCASLIYTSGTTGNPKAAMISHDNITYLVRHLAFDIVKMKTFQERIVSYLPLSHIAAQIVDLFCPLLLGSTVYFAQPDALKGSLANTLQYARPTFFFGVPRVWEKFQEKMQAAFNKLTGNKLKLINWARQVTYKEILDGFNRRVNYNPSYVIAKELVLKKIHKQIGLDQCINFYSGAAPITKETLDFFLSIGIPLCEVYGMSESTGPHSCGVYRYNRVTSVGAVNNFNRTKLHNKELDGSGELCMDGRNIFMGYLNSESKTAETIDSEGWLHTGDIAKIDSDGFIYITGRLKELIITAGGENIAPIPIEDSIKSELPRLISNCMLVGDKKKYLVVLVTLKSKVDLDTLEPLDDLTEDCIQFLKSIGSKSTRVSDIIDNNDPLVYKEIEKAIKRANDKSVSRASKVQKFAILPRDFSLPTGELGPTLKLRRPIVAKMYQDVINELYIDRGDSNE